MTDTSQLSEEIQERLAEKFHIGLRNSVAITHTKKTNERDEN